MRLKEIIKKKTANILEAHSGISAMVAQDSGFDGIWESSLTDSASRGLPDNELVSMSMRLEKIREILNVITKPLIVDGDTGGSIEHFPYWVKQLEKEGVQAVIIEDKAFPKINSLKNAEHQLEKVNRFCEKIKAGKSAVKDMMIIARLESLIAGHDMNEALYRANRFVKAGADGIMIHSKISVGDEVMKFAEKFKGDVPLVCVPTTYKLPKKHPFKIVIFANHLLRASYLAMKKASENPELCEMASVKEILNLCL